MRKILEFVADALFVAAILPFALVCGGAASRAERHDTRLKAIDGGMTPEEARRAFP